MVAARDGPAPPARDQRRPARSREETLHELSEVLRESIRAGLSSRREALGYALQFARGLDEALADRFVGMYVNELTEDYGDEGREAVAELLRRGERAGAFDCPVRVEFVA